MRNYSGPFILIGVGIFLLLHQLDILYFEWRDVLTYGFILLGFIMIWNAFDNPQKKGLLGGVFFLTYGTALSMMRLGFVFPDDTFGIGTLLLSIGFANLVYFGFHRTHTWNLIWAMLFGVAGGLMIMVYFDYLSHWEVVDQVEMYWPVALIIVGLIVLLRSGSHHKQEATNGA